MYPGDHDAGLSVAGFGSASALVGAAIVAATATAAVVARSFFLWFIGFLRCWFGEVCGRSCVCPEGAAQVSQLAGQVLGLVAREPRQIAAVWGVDLGGDD